MMKFLGLLHDVLVSGAIPLLPPYFLLLASKGDFVGRIRRGVLPRFNLNKIDSDVVIHSSSIGETKNAVLFSELMRKEFPDIKIAHSVFTGTAEELFRSKVEVKAIPIPLFVFTRRFLSPRLKLLIIFEGDLWPGYIIASKSFGARVIIISGKISSRTQRILRFFPIITSMVDCVFSADPPEVFKDAGFPCVIPSVNLKSVIFLRVPEKAGSSEVDERRIAIAGMSLRGPAEIKFILDTAYEIQKYGYKVYAFIAPRHNFSEAEIFLRKNGVKLIKFSELAGTKMERENLFNSVSTNFIFVDRYGEVERFLPVCDFVFVGGTISNFGGHNVLEPIAFGIPTVVGPHIWNIENSDELIREHVINVVRTPKEFAELAKSKNRLKSYTLSFSKKMKEIVSRELQKIFEYIQGCIYGGSEIHACNLYRKS